MEWGESLILRGKEKMGIIWLIHKGSGIMGGISRGSEISDWMFHLSIQKDFEGECR